MSKIMTSPLFGIVLCIVAFQVGIIINKIVKIPVANPLLIAIGFVILILNVFHIPINDFQNGSNVINMLLGPVTAVLALTIYKQIEILKKNFWPVLVGCLVGSITSMTSSYLLCRLFGLGDQITASMIPKSVTTPIAMEISGNLNGITSITVAAVVLTGILGSIFAPLLIKVFYVKDSVAVGVAIGTSSHAVGTTKAIELGEIEGAMSGVAIGVAGILTVFLAAML